MNDRIMQKKIVLDKKQIMIAGAVVVTVFFVGWFGGMSYQKYKMTHSFPGAMRPNPGAAVDFAALQEKDLKILQNEKSSDLEVTAALARLSSTRNPLALKEALKRVKSSVPPVRSGAIRALGYFDTPEANQELAELAKTSDPQVRGDVIASVSMVPSPQREKILLELEKQKDLSPQESFQIKIKLMQISQSEQKKNELLQQVISKIEKEQDNQQVIGLASQVLMMSSRNPVTIRFLEKVLATGKPKQLVPIAINQLASSQPEQMMKQLPNLLHSSDLSMRKNALQLIAQLCPKDRWSILEAQIKQEKDPEVRMQVIQIAGRLGGEKAKSFLNRLIEIKSLNEGELNNANSILKMFETRTMPDMCEQRATGPGSPMGMPGGMQNPNMLPPRSPSTNQMPMNPPPVH